MAYSLGSWTLTNSASDDVPSLYESIPKVKIVVIQGTNGKKEMVDPAISWEELVARYPNMEIIEMD
jgi:Ni,Fe-hydrogenase III small subunit